MLRSFAPTAKIDHAQESISLDRFTGSFFSSKTVKTPAGQGKAKKLRAATRRFEKRFVLTRPEDEFVLRGRRVVAASRRAANKIAQLVVELQLYAEAVREPR